jgi:predicted phosphodiesterase
MKYAVIADIHANLEALDAVLQDVKAQRCTHVVCLGDIVGYNASPKECLDIVRGMNVPCVKGNHDEYCSTAAPLGGFNPQAAEAVEWTRNQLTEDDRQWLGSLPYVQTVAGFTIVHATLDSPQRWGYVFDKLAAAASFAHQKTPLCFFGHTHVPVAFMQNSVVRGGTYQKFRVKSGRKYFVNVGAVGQPRDNNPKAAYATYDVDCQTIELHRVDYDIPGAQGRIKTAGLPRVLR